MLAIWVFHQRHIRAVSTFLLLLLAAGFYTLGYYFELRSSNFPELFFWLRIKYLGLPFIPFLWLRFILLFTDRDRYLSSFLWPLIFAIPVVSLVLVFMGPNTNLFYQSLGIRQVNGLSTPVIVPGAWAYIHFIASTLAFLVAAAVLVVSILKANSYIRLRSIILLAAVTLPWIFSVIFLAGYSPNNFDLTPFALIITVFILIFEISKLKLFNILPLARSRIFDVISNGIIIVDGKGNIADLNPWAKTNLGIREELIGSDFMQLFPGQESLFEPLFSSKAPAIELMWEKQPSEKWFEIWQRPLTNKKGLLLGRLITITDISLRKENEKALSRERILLRTLIDNLPVSVYVKDIEGRKILANKTDLRYMGLNSEEEALGKTDFDIYPAEVAESFYSSDQKVLQTGVSILDQEEYLTHGQGGHHWLLTSKVPFQDDKGKKLGILGIGRDITEWKKMQQELANSEERFRTLTETTSAAVFIFQGERYLYLNPASEKLTGYKAEELKQMHFRDLVHPDHREWIQKLINRAPLPEKTRQFEFKIITRDGSQKWINYSTGLTCYQGQMVAIGTCFDITERKIAEEALGRSELRYRKIFENSNTGILQFYPRGEVINANNAFAQMLGYETAADILAEKTGIYQKLFAHQADQIRFFRQMEQKDFIRNFEFEAQQVNGKKIWVMVNAWKNQTQKDQATLIEGFFLDITDRMLALEYQNEMEIARKSSETKNQFLANMSHEIRTPVTGIMGMTEVLFKTPLSNRQKEYLTTIEESSQKLLEIINEILDISKIEAGKMELRPESFNLEEMLNSLQNMFGPFASKRNLALNFELMKDIPQWFRGDKKRIEQILINLISNALKFTHQGQVQLSISCSQVNNNQHQLHFEVRDTGIGIKPSDQARLFRKFSQLDNSLTRVTEGTGLGLFICRELVKLMGGEIHVKSHPGQGSTFWFSIVLEAASRENKTELLNLNKPEPFNNLHILVVDDKLVNRKVLALLLEGEGCKVDLASNGLEALEKYDPLRHQMVFMDIMMPVMDGVSAMKELHKKYPNMAPIVALTANAMEGDAQNYLASGFHDYLAKPVTRKDLQKMLQKWILISN